MYNRYIPQPDGTYRRNRMPDPQRPAPPQQPPCPPEAPPKPPERPPQAPPPRNSPPPRRRQNRQQTDIKGFLRQLLPGDFGTEDLLVVLLLLLMAGDCQEDQNNALLTLALYLFL